MPGEHPIAVREEVLGYPVERRLDELGLIQLRPGPVEPRFGVEGEGPPYPA